MSEDEFDFAGQNPATHLPIDRKAIPFDYEARLQQQGYTKKGLPDMGGLFKALASEYVPTRVVHLPPKVITRVRVRDVLGSVLGFFWTAVFLLAFYVGLVGVCGVLMPYMNFSSFEVRTHLLPGATCTVTNMHIESNEDSNGVTDYTPVVDSTLHTPDGRIYQAHEYWSSSYYQQADAQQYLSRFQINRSYLCWYNSTNPTEASFFAVKVGFWDYFWLAMDPVAFLTCGVLPNLLILRILDQSLIDLVSALGQFLIGLVSALGQSLIDLVRGRIELVW